MFSKGKATMVALVKISQDFQAASDDKYIHSIKSGNNTDFCGKVLISVFRVVCRGTNKTLADMKCLEKVLPIFEFNAIQVRSKPT